MYCIGIEMCKVLHIDASCISVAIFSLHMDQQIPQILWNDNEERERVSLKHCLSIYVDMYKCSTCLPSLFLVYLLLYSYPIWLGFLVILKNHLNIW